MGSVHTVEYYSAIKRKEVLTHATVRMNLDIITLSERSQTQTASYCMISFTSNVQNRQLHGDKNPVIARGGGEWQ